jgi:Protein of unknown function (DUF1569)
VDRRAGCGRRRQAARLRARPAGIGPASLAVDGRAAGACNGGMSEQSIFRADGAAALLQRVQRLRADSPARWGRMDAAQMLAHCQQPLRVVLGDLRMKRGLAGYLFGGLARKSMLGPRPYKLNLPTAPEFRIRDPRDFERERAALVALVQRCAAGGPAAITRDPHPFFGPLTTEEWEGHMLKHLDHHLRQFGVD